MDTPVPGPAPAETAPGDGDYAFAGLRLRSALPLHDLSAWAGPADRPVDLTISPGLVPDPLPDAVVRRPLLQVGADGTCRFAIEGVAAWLITPGNDRIIVQMGEAEPAAMRLFLFGTVLGIVLMRRGLLPLHGCCVERDGRAYAVCGRSGAGKSTLATLLTGRGFRLLADDMTVIDGQGGVPLVLPTFPRVKLWRDMLDRLDVDAGGLEPVRRGLEKYHRPLPEFFCAEPRPLAGLMLLDDAAGPDPRRLTPMECLANLPTIVYRQQMMVRLGLGDRQMAQYLRLISAVGGCTMIGRPGTPAALDGLLPLFGG